MKFSPTENSLIVIVPIADADNNKPFLSEKEWHELENKKSPQRRNEWSTWRRVVREELGAEVTIWYDEIGAPHVRTSGGEEIKISVSHSRSHVAVMFSRGRCGLDMEQYGRNFERISNRYISNREEALVAEANRKAIIWCAKEAIYKYGGYKEIDLKRDIIIVSADWVQKQLTAKLRGEDIPKLSFIEFENQIICWLTE